MRFVADPLRLQHLKAQREAIARHLAWLDQEIQAAQANGFGATPTAGPASPSPLPFPPRDATAPHRTAGTPTSTQAVDTMLDELLQNEPDSDSQFSKTGCWLTFVALLFLGGALTIGAIYLFWG